MWVVLFFELIVLGALCVLVLRQYISFKRTPKYAIGSTWLGWLICFAIVFLVPIDIADADHTKCLNEHHMDEHMCDEPLSYLPPSVMKVQWSILYWGTLVMSWLLFPILQTFFLSSDFTTWERFKRAIRENIYLYIGMAIVGGIFLASLAIARNINGGELMNLVMALANAYGLCLVVVLMGYGLVDIPRYLFRRADREGTLKFYHAQLAKFKEDMDAAEEQLTITLQLVKAIADRTKQQDPYRYYVDIILTKCPPQYEDITNGDGDIGDLTESKLVALHGRVREDRHNVERAVCLYEMCLRKAFKVEDIIHVKEVGSADSKMHWSFIPARTYNHANIVDTLEYYWEVYLHTSAHRAAAILGALMSVIIVWCEITLVASYNNKDLSPFSQIIQASKMQNFGKQLFCFIPLAYMTLCAYTTLFKIRLFNYYRLVPHQMSDPHSIMFSANYLCRLAAPLAFNFLKIIHQDDSAFTTVMGEMDAFPFLGKQFIFGFPIFVAIVCMMTLFNIWGKIGSMCCIRKLRYIPEDDFKLVSEGEALLKQERDKREGKGVPSGTIKQVIRGRQNKAFKHASKDANKPHTGEPDSPAGAHSHPEEPSKPLTAVQSIGNKYRRGNGDPADVPSGSRFFKSEQPGSVAPLPAPPRARTSGLDDLLPANSRFSRNAAILNNNIEPSDSLRDFSQTSSAPISAPSSKPTFNLGGLFGGGRRNDEVGLLPRRGDSLV